MHYDIAQFWPGGFQAKVTIVIKREVKFGWLMKLTFTSPVTSMEIFDAQVAEISEGTVRFSFSKLDDGLVRTPGTSVPNRTNRPYRTVHV